MSSGSAFDDDFLSVLSGLCDDDELFFKVPSGPNLSSTSSINQENVSYPPTQYNYATNCYEISPSSSTNGYVPPITLPPTPYTNIPPPPYQPSFSLPYPDHIPLVYPPATCPPNLTPKTTATKTTTSTSSKAKSKATPATKKNSSTTSKVTVKSEYQPYSMGTTSTSASTMNMSTAPAYNVQVNDDGGDVDYAALEKFLPPNYLKNLDPKHLDYDEDDLDSLKNPKKKSRRGKNDGISPEAEVIAEATNQYLKMLNIDPNSKEGKKQRRRIRNRMSAQLHRERKRLYIETLEASLKDKEATITTLQSQVKNLKMENDELKAKLDELTKSKATAQSYLSSDVTSGEDNETEYMSDSSLSSSGWIDEHDPSGATTEAQAGNQKKRNRALSLLSVVMLFGMTYFSGLFPSTSMVDMSPLTLPYLTSPWSSAEADSTNSAGLVTFPPQSAGRILMSYESEEMSPLSPSRAEFIASVPAVSMSSPTAESSSEASAVSLSTFKSPVPPAVSPLWRYQKDIASIYPEDVSKVVNQSKPSLLRGVKNRPNYDHEMMGQLLSSDYVSQILVTDGRALMEPSIVARYLTPAAGNNNAMVAFNHPSIRSSVKPRPDNATSNDIVMLIPFSSVQWGNTWNKDGDAEETSMAINRALLNNLLKNEGSGVAGENGTTLNSVEDISSLWLEVKCSLKQARVVENVVA